MATSSEALPFNPRLGIEGGRPRVLVVDDHEDTAVFLASALRGVDFEAEVATGVVPAIAALEHAAFDVLLADLKLGSESGLDVCRAALARRPHLAVVVMTGFSSMEAAVHALRAGAIDFLSKPVDVDEVVSTVTRALGARRVLAPVPALGSDAEDVLMTGRSMTAILDAVGRIAPTDATVLVSGESGSGKERIARLLHDASGRARGPFVALNCAAVPSSLLESELFGHARGAFTDARGARRGLFSEADGGTLLLDEIGEMPLEMQVKLLRALQERCVRPVGSNEEVAFDARIVAATNRDLEQEVAEGRFRQDLFYRVNVVSIRVPPLRERPDDVAALAAHFLRRYGARFRKALEGFGPGVLARLCAYDWPGNVRELENAIEHAVVMATTARVTLEDLPARVQPHQPPSQGIVSEGDALATLSEVESRYIRHVLRVVGGNKAKAARVLGIDRRSLYRRLS